MLGGLIKAMEEARKYCKTTIIKKCDLKKQIFDLSVLSHFLGLSL